MKRFPAVGWSLGAASFLFATYVSITGGPDLRMFAQKPDQERVQRIAASAAQTASAGHQHGCCPREDANTAKETEKQKHPCGASGLSKCEHD